MDLLRGLTFQRKMPKIYRPRFFDPKRLALFNAWRRMRSRCRYPKIKILRYWAGKGIKVCAEWETCFEAFERDMGDSWFEGASLDRKDSNDHYHKGNCRWVTREEQARNQASRKGISNHPPEWKAYLREAMKGAGNPNFGHRWTDEMKKAMSIKKKALTALKKQAE
jgi:hypothetical protein